MKRKQLIQYASLITIFVFIILAVIIGILGYNQYKDNKKKQAIADLSKDFARAWYTYSKQSDVSYINSLKQYMTTDFFEATNYINTERPQDFEEQPPSTVQIYDVKNIEINNDTAKSLVELQQIENGINRNNIQMVLDFKHTDNLWKVSNIE